LSGDTISASKLMIPFGHDMFFRAPMRFVPDTFWSDTIFYVNTFRRAKNPSNNAISRAASLLFNHVSSAQGRFAMPKHG
jgi:hypothetical protein